MAEGGRCRSSPPPPVFSFYLFVLYENFRMFRMHVVFLPCVCFRSFVWPFFLVRVRCSCVRTWFFFLAAKSFTHLIGVIVSLFFRHIRIRSHLDYSIEKGFCASAQL